MEEIIRVMNSDYLWWRESFENRATTDTPFFRNHFMINESKAIARTKDFKKSESMTGTGPELLAIAAKIYP